MKHHGRQLALILGGCGMLCVILDSRCSAECAADALRMCMQTVIPSLFPMFVLSALLTSALMGTRNRFFSRLESTLGLPAGGGGIFMLGILGGFPVGAQCIAQAVDAKALSRNEGAQMLGFCNHCGPAFLFGILGAVFSDPYIPVLIFLIQLETALLLAAFRNVNSSDVYAVRPMRISLAEAVQRGIRSMVSVCAWVILGGVVNGFLARWVYPLLPFPIPVLISGLLELTGGVMNLASVPNPQMQLIFCTVFVCFGGVCVMFQIQSVAARSGLSMETCIHQKCIQSILGGMIAFAVGLWGPLSLLIAPIFLLFRKKAVAIPKKTMYNDSQKGGY